MVHANYQLPRKCDLEIALSVFAAKIKTDCYKTQLAGE